MTRRLESTILFITFTSATVLGVDRYVIPNGATISPYDTWDKAASNIQIAIDAAVPDDTVWVTNGIYDTGERVTPGYSCSNRVVIVTTITVRSVNGPVGTTILGTPDPVSDGNGPNAVRGVYMSAGLLHGFTIASGHTRAEGHADFDRSGGGVNMTGGNGAISNCIIASNGAYGDGGGIFGGTANNCTISSNSSGGGGGTSDCMVNNCTISGNSAIWDLGGGDGGGIFGGTANNCRISGNSAGGGGGGASDCMVNNCIIVSNSAFGGGGTCNSTVSNCMINGNSSVLGGGTYGGMVNNCIIMDNFAQGGGGTYGGMVNNCTIIYNCATTPSLDGGGGGMNGADVRNSILYGNYLGPDTQNWTNGSIVYSCTLPLPPGPGNISTDPAFVGIDAGNLHLQPWSPCIDKGSNVYAPIPFDLDGNPRIINGIVDMGAYEWQGGLWCTFSARPAVPVLGTVVFRSTVGGTNTQDIYYRWDFEDDGVIEIEGTRSNAPIWVYPSEGVYSVYLQVSNEVGETAQELRTNCITVVPEPAVVSVLAIVAVLAHRKIKSKAA